MLIGGNIGDRQRFLANAIEEIERRAGNLLKKSSIYETEPWGNEKQENFLNQVVLVETNLQPYVLLDELLQIEEKFGRIRRKEQKFGARSIDIDILFYEFLEEGFGGNNKVQLVINEEHLKIPHPFLHLRRFSLVPMCEIAPGLIHPLFNKSVTELLHNCPDKLLVKKLDYHP